MSKKLIVGYGNPDREDDGVAWHILSRVQAHFAGNEAGAQDNQSILDLEVGERQYRDDVPDLLGMLQLTPEVAEIMAGYDRVCFVDAHTGAYADDLHVTALQAKFQNSPFTHHMTPETCLTLAQTLYGRSPQGIVVSVRGYRFGFEHTLSPATAEFASEAFEQILAWLEKE